jgi:hypothetical protein
MGLDLNYEVQKQIDSQIAQATYKGCRLLDSEITLTFEIGDKTFDLRVVADDHGIFPVLRERK